MKLPVRIRLTIIFSLIFAGLLILSSTLIYQRVSRDLYSDFRLQIIRDSRIIAELFKEELKLKALKEFEQEIKEFNFDLQILDEHKKPMVVSDSWEQHNITLSNELFSTISTSPVFQRITLHDKPYLLYSRTIHIPSHGEYSLHLARSEEAVKKIPATLLKWMLIIKPFMILIAALAGYLFSTRILQAEEDAFKRLKRFTADASHELRIPLTALRGNLDVALRKKRSPEEYVETIENALDEAEHLSQLTQNLLLLAQSDDGKIKLTQEKTNVKEFLEDVVSQSHSIKNDHHIAVTLNTPAEGEAFFDADKIRQVLLNLIDNAIKYNQPQGRVQVGAELTKDTVKFTVKDSGIGIAEEDKEKIFDRFFRVDKSRSREQGGSGLGLSIAHWIVKAHQGKIRLESQLGTGSTFTVVLPRHPQTSRNSEENPGRFFP